MGRKGKESKEIEKLDLEIQFRSVPDGGWGWLVCLAGFIAQFIVLGIQNNTGILYKALLDEFKQSKGDTGKRMSPSSCFDNSPVNDNKEGFLRGN